MPTYDFVNNETGEEFESFMSIAAREQYLKDNAQMELLESERIKEKIRNFEQDMWSY